MSVKSLWKFFSSIADARKFPGTDYQRRVCNCSFHHLHGSLTYLLVAYFRRHSMGKQIGDLIPAPD